MDTFNWDLEYIDNTMRLWEFNLYVEMLEDRLEKEEQERKKHQN